LAQRELSGAQTDAGYTVAIGGAAIFLTPAAAMSILRLFVGEEPLPRPLWRVFFRPAAAMEARRVNPFVSPPL
jgi:hypothetical protein